MQTRRHEDSGVRRRNQLRHLDLMKLDAREHGVADANERASLQTKQRLIQSTRFACVYYARHDSLTPASKPKPNSLVGISYVSAPRALSRHLPRPLLRQHPAHSIPSPALGLPLCPSALPDFCTASVSTPRAPPLPPAALHFVVDRHPSPYRARDPPGPSTLPRASLPRSPGRWLPWLTGTSLGPDVGWTRRVRLDRAIRWRGRAVVSRWLDGAGESGGGMRARRGFGRGVAQWWRGCCGCGSVLSDPAPC